MEDGLEKLEVITGVSQQAIDACVKKIDQILGYGKYIEGTYVECSSYEYKTDNLYVGIKGGFSYWSDASQGAFTTVNLSYKNREGFLVEDTFQLGERDGEPRVFVESFDELHNRTVDERPLSDEDIVALNVILDLVMTDPEIMKVDMGKDFGKLSDELRDFTSINSNDRNVWEYSVFMDGQKTTIGHRYSKHTHGLEWFVVQLKKGDAVERVIAWDDTDTQRYSTQVYSIERPTEREGDTSDDSQEVELQSYDLMIAKKAVEAVKRRATRAPFLKHPDIITRSELNSLKDIAYDLAKAASSLIEHNWTLGQLRKSNEEDNLKKELLILSNISDKTFESLVSGVASDLRLQAHHLKGEEVMRQVRATIEEL